MQPTLKKTAPFRLFQLISPTLPVGAFAYSQGLEMAVEKQIVVDMDSTKTWLSGLIQNNLSFVDLPLLIRLSQALSDQENQNCSGSFREWNDWLIAARETRELHLESTLMAQALLRLLTSFCDSKDAHLIPDNLPKPLDWVSAFALACWLWQIELDDALAGFAWSWLENQVAAAIKLVPLGQTQGQQLLLELSSELETAIEVARRCSDSELGRMSPMQVMLSAKHETQYSRLFRS